MTLKYYSVIAGLAIAGVTIVVALAIILMQNDTPSAQQQQQVVVGADSEEGGENQNGNNSWPNVHSNVDTDFNPAVKFPQISESAFIHPFAVLIGDCYIGKMVLVAPTAVCRGDEGTPIHVGDYSNIQDGVVLHALETTDNGNKLDGRRFSKDGTLLMGNDSRFDEGYAVWVGDRVSLAHGSLIHGPAWIGNDTFVGMEAMVFNAKVGNNVAIGVASTITGGVVVPDNRFVPPGAVITTQEQADALPPRVGSPYENINEGVIHVNENLAEGYDEMDLEKIIRDREAQMERGMLETSQPHPAPS